MEELIKNGYSRRESGTEYMFLILERFKAVAEKGDPEDVIEAYKGIVDELKERRPVNAGAWNIMREIGKYLIEKDYDKDSFISFIEGLRKKIDEACWEAARVASHRVLRDDVIITLSRGVCLRRFFKILADTGRKVKVYVMESRPGMEGIDLADYLDKLGFETYLIVDSAARFFVKNCTKAFISAEAVAVNGAVVGKVGSSLLSLASNEARVRVYVIAPLYKFSPETIYGELLKLPEGDWTLLMSPDVRAMLPENYRARAPVYDVTPPQYIDGIATDAGLFAPQAVPVILKQIYGSFPPRILRVDEIIESLEKKYIW